MAAIEKSRVSSSNSTTVQSDSPSSNAAAGSHHSNIGRPDMKKFNALTATRGGSLRGVFGHIGNVSEIMAGGVRGTPADLVERVLEHEPELALLQKALS